MPDVLIIGDSLRSAELRHEVPLGVGDEFLYAEVGGTRHVAVVSFEAERVAAVAPALEVHTLEEFGYDELIARGLRNDRFWAEVWLATCTALGVRDAVVPREFPLLHGDHLRANGIELTVDDPFFVARRRVKTDVQLAGIRRACRAVEAGMALGLDLLRSAEPANGLLVLDGEPFTCERIKLAIEQEFGEHGAAAEEFIVSHGAQTAVGHDMGSGPIGANDVVLFDLFPRDRETACFADFTRTVHVGEPSAEIREYHRLAKEALDLAVAAIRPGVNGADVHRQVCEFFHGHGYPTQLHKRPGEPLRDGYYHATGHGVGLAVHESPRIGRLGDELVAGDVVALEPGLYTHGVGGVRLEDLVLVTETGAEVLTEFPYDLEIA
jgi:Xaa-Pro aminopeptidase